MPPRRILLLGATGLVGNEVLRLLLADDSIERVVVMTRRPTGHTHAKLDEHILDLAEMEQHGDAFAVDAILCALGTTIRVAGSQERFRSVDHDLPLLAARLGLANGATHYLLVSSLGADPKSRVFYNRVKGEVEADLLALPYPKITIVRPSFLVGPRPEFRLGEQIVSRLGWLMPQRVKPIEARVVAQALVALAKREDGRARIIESRELRAVAAGGRV
ncbi:MAG: NAD-dependent epimerase/dehydratase family protein [Thermoanaerobaculia bacterium]